MDKKWGKSGPQRKIGVLLLKGAMDAGISKITDVPNRG